MARFRTMNKTLYRCGFSETLTEGYLAPCSDTKFVMTREPPSCDRRRCLLGGLKQAVNICHNISLVKNAKKLKILHILNEVYLKLSHRRLFRLFL